MARTAPHASACRSFGPARAKPTARVPQRMAWISGRNAARLSAVLAQREADNVDADLIDHQTEAPGGPAYQPLIDRFGPWIVAADGTLYRPALAAVAFNDKQSQTDLNAITHPLVGKEMARQIA